VIPELPRFLTVAELSRLADNWVNGKATITDIGALAAAALRPALDLDGERIYRDQFDQAAALMHALIATRPFGRDVGPGLGLFAALTALHANGIRLGNPDSEHGERLVEQVAAGLDDVGVIAAHLRRIAAGEPWRSSL